MLQLSYSTYEINWITLSPSNRKIKFDHKEHECTGIYGSKHELTWPHTAHTDADFPTSFLHMYNAGHGTSVTQHSLIPDRLFYHHKTDRPPVWNLLGTVLSSQRACRLCSIIDTVGEDWRDERMTELMGEATERVYWSLSALIWSQREQERRNTGNMMTAWETDGAKWKIEREKEEMLWKNGSGGGRLWYSKFSIWRQILGWGMKG